MYFLGMDPEAGYDLTNSRLVRSWRQQGSKQEARNMEEIKTISREMSYLVIGVCKEMNSRLSDIKLINNTDLQTTLQKQCIHKIASRSVNVY